MKILNTVALVICCFFLGINQVYAESSTEDWKYEFSPYLLAAGMEGDIGIHHHTADLDVSFSDIWDDLDAGFMGLFTAHKGSLLLGLEGVYMKLEGDTSKAVTGPVGIVSGNGELEITNKMYIAQATIGYRLLDDNTKLYALGAVRYNKLEVEMDVETTFTPPIFGTSRSEDESKNWTDAVIGLHVLHPVSDNVVLTGYADVGAGGSDLTYQFMGGINWELSETFTAKLGYRYLYWDYEDDGFIWDVSANGPYLGVGIRF